MEKKNHSAKFVKQRKFLVILPMLTLPFLTLMFWAFGGGKGNNAAAQSSTQQGLNLKLPDAKLKDEKALNKLSFYQQAALDSAKTKEAERLDPYWNKSFTDSGFESRYNAGLNNNGIDANQMKVYSKLDELKTALSKSQEASNMYSKSNNNSYSLKSYSSTNDVERLQSMMQKMNEDKTEDPEITQLNEMLDKIQAIQNPDQTKSISTASTRKSLSVKKKNRKADISLLKPQANNVSKIDTGIVANSGNGFYSISTFDESSDSSINNSIEAIIPETQTIVTGSTIKLALSSDITIQNVNIPSGTPVYGTASLSNERLKISITSIRYQSSILPVTLNVYDMDGQEGVYIPGSINRTVAKESTNNAMSGIGTTTVDPSIGAQAASAGIEAAKTLFSKKIKLIKMTVKAGYKVLLRDNHDK